ncbi:hypothetical protein Trydic_g17802 [Trypoxylus dichotomus]
MPSSSTSSSTTDDDRISSSMLAKCAGTACKGIYSGGGSGSGYYCIVVELVLYRVGQLAVRTELAGPAGFSSGSVRTIAFTLLYMVYAIPGVLLVPSDPSGIVATPPSPRWDVSRASVPFRTHIKRPVHDVFAIIFYGAR